MVWWCIQLTRLTLVCEVIRYRLFQVRHKVKKKKKDFSGWRPAIAFLYLFLFHSLLRLTFFLSQYKNEEEDTWKCGEARLRGGLLLR